MLLDIARTSEVVVEIEGSLLAEKGRVDANGGRRGRANIVERDFETVHTLRGRAVHACEARGIKLLLCLSGGGGVDGRPVHSRSGSMA